VRFWSEQPEPANNVKPVRRMMGQEEVEHRNILHDTKKSDPQAAFVDGS